MARCRASDEEREATDRNGAVYEVAKTVSNPVTQVANPGIYAVALQIAGYEREIKAVLRPYVPPGLELEDLVQESILEALKSIRARGPPNKPAPWLRTVAIRAAKRQARTHYRQMRGSRTGYEAECDLADPYTHAERKDEIARVLEVIEGMNSEEQEVIIRHYLQEKPCARIAEELGITENNTKQRLFRARNKLREQLRTEAE